MFVANPSWRGQYLPFGFDNWTVAPVKAMRGVIVPSGLGLRSGLGMISTPCSTWMDSIFNTACWSTSPEVMSQTVPALPAPVPPAAPTGATLTTAPASAQQAQAAIDQLTQAAAQETQANALQAFQSFVAPDYSTSAAADSGSSGIPWWVWAAAGGLGIVILGKALR